MQHSKVNIVQHIYPIFVQNMYLRGLETIFSFQSRMNQAIEWTKSVFWEGGDPSLTPSEVLLHITLESYFCTNYPK